MGNYLPAVIYDNNKDKDDTETESPKMCVTDFCEHFQVSQHTWHTCMYVCGGGGGRACVRACVDHQPSLN